MPGLQIKSFYAPQKNRVDRAKGWVDYVTWTVM